MNNISTAQLSKPNTSPRSYVITKYKTSARVPDIFARAPPTAHATSATTKSGTNTFQFPNSR